MSGGFSTVSTGRITIEENEQPA